MAHDLIGKIGVKAVKISTSASPDLILFLDEQCLRFGVGRSVYLQMLLSAERAAPRNEFITRARVTP